MHQSTTPSLLQTIWPKWASSQFLTLPILQTLFPVTFGFSLSSEPVVMRQLRRWKRLWRRSSTRSHKRISRSCLNGTNKCIALRGDYFEGDESFMCALSIKVLIRKKSGNLSYAPRTFYHSISLYSIILLIIWESLHQRYWWFSSGFWEGVCSWCNG